MKVETVILAYNQHFYVQILDDDVLGCIDNLGEFLMQLLNTARYGNEGDNH